VSVSDLYIPMTGLPILLQENMWTDYGNINRSQTHECAEIESEQFLFLEYINGIFVSVCTLLASLQRDKRYYISQLYAFHLPARVGKARQWVKLLVPCATSLYCHNAWSSLSPTLSLALSTLPTFIRQYGMFKYML
jgi:hypothetical protein